MEISDIQHINVNKLLHVLGKEVMCDIIANALEQGKKKKLIRLVTYDTVEFVNYSQTWSQSKYHSEASTHEHPDGYWQLVHDKLKKELPALLKDTTFADETPLFLFADVFAERQKQFIMSKQIKVWD